MILAPSLSNCIARVSALAAFDFLEPPPLVVHPDSIKPHAIMTIRSDIDVFIVCVSPSCDVNCTRETVARVHHQGLRLMWMWRANAACCGMDRGRSIHPVLYSIGVRHALYVSYAIVLGLITNGM